MSEKSLTASAIWDRLGIGVSTVCAIHCLFFPVLIALMPVASVSSVSSDWLHPLFVILIAPTVYFAAKRSHFARTVTSLLLAGFILILAGWLIGHYWLGFWAETVLTIGGSIVLITGHWRNYRHHQTCENKAHHHHSIEGESKETE